MAKQLKTLLKENGTSLAKLAAALDVNKSTVTRWGNRIPPERLLAIERATGIPRQKLRPDLFENMEIHAGDTQAH